MKIFKCDIIVCKACRFDSLDNGVLFTVLEDDEPKCISMKTNSNGCIDLTGDDSGYYHDYLPADMLCTEVFYELKEVAR